jgi:large subunit ribosomal protein L24
MMRIKKNDTVMILTGRDKKKRGRVLEFMNDRQRLLVEGVNMVKRHVKAGRDPKAPRGGIIEVAASVHISNVKLICSKCGKPTSASIRKLDDGKKIRFCKNCNESLDKEK